MLILLRSVKLDLYANESEVYLSFIAANQELYSTFVGIPCASWTLIKCYGVISLQLFSLR